MYNPSVKTVILNRIALTLGFIGIFVSGVLSIGARYDGKVPCGISKGCEAVANHPSSKLLFGIPNAYVGLAIYVLLAALAYYRLLKPDAGRGGLMIAYVVTAVGSLISIGLTYYSFAVIRASCIWCLSSALVMILSLLVHALLVQAKPESKEPTGVDTIFVVSLALSTMILLGVIGASIANDASTRGISSMNLKKVDPKIILPADAHVFGDPNAPMTIVEFGDLVCPQCRTEFPTVRQFVGAHPGQVKYVFRHFPLVLKEGHEAAFPAAVLSEIASESNLFWQYVESIYSFEPEKRVNIDDALEVARNLGIDTEKALKRIPNQNDPAFKKVNLDLNNALGIGVQGTPTFIILAPGVEPRAAMAETLYRDLDRDEYKPFLKNAK